MQMATEYIIWQCHRALRIPEILERICDYLIATTDIKNLAEAMEGMMTSCIHKTRAGRMHDHHIDESEIASRKISQDLFANYYRARWVSQRRRLGCPIAKHLLNSDAWSDNVWILHHVFGCAERSCSFTLSTRYIVGDPRLNGGKLPMLSNTIVPRCIDCFRYLPISHHFRSIPQSERAEICDPVDVRLPELLNPPICFDCLNMRAPMVDVFTAWGLLAKLIGPAGRYAIGNDDLETQASITPSAKDRSRKGSGAVRAGIKAPVHRPFPIAKKDVGDSVFKAYMAAPKSIAGCPWDPAISPHFERKTQTTDIDGDSFEISVYPSPGTDPIPYIRPKDLVRTPVTLNWGGIGLHDMPKGFGLGCKQRRAWLRVMLKQIFHHPLLVPDEFYAKSMCVFKLKRTLGHQTILPLGENLVCSGVHSIDNDMAEGNTHINTYGKWGHNPWQKNLCGSYGLRAGDSISRNPGGADVDPSTVMTIPSSAMAMVWQMPDVPRPDSCTEEKYDYSCKLGPGAGSKYENGGCDRGSSSCPIHNANAGNRYPDDWATESEQAIPWDHGGSRTWFFFEEDIRAMANLLRSWITTRDKPLPILLNRMVKYTNRDASVRRIWVARRDRTSDPMWRSLDPENFPSPANDERVRVRNSLMRRCSGQEFQDASVPACPFPWMVHQNGIREYDTMSFITEKLMDNLRGRTTFDAQMLTKPIPIAVRNGHNDCIGRLACSESTGYSSVVVRKRKQFERFSTDSMYCLYQYGMEDPPQLLRSRFDEDLLARRKAKKDAEEAANRPKQLKRKCREKQVADTFKSFAASKSKKKTKKAAPVKDTKKRNLKSKLLTGGELAGYLADMESRFRAEWIGWIESEPKPAAEHVRCLFNSWLKARERGKKW